MKKRIYPLFIILAAVIWSTDGLIRRYLSAIPASTIVLLEYIIRLIIISPFIVKFVPEFKKLTKKDWMIVATLGITSGALGRIMYTAALGQVNNISYSVVSLLQQTQPLFAVLFAIIILKERISFRYACLAIIALIAAYFLAFPNYFPTFIGNKGEVVAAGLALGAAFVWGFGTVLSKMLLGKLSYAALSILRFIIVVPVAFLIHLGIRHPYPISAITPTQWFYLTAIALTSGIASFFLYYKGLQHTEVKISTFSEFAWPLSAVFFGYILLGDRLTSIQLIAAAILLVDILVLSFTTSDSK